VAERLREVAASLIARSSATQHITFEYRKCRGSPRTSQMPWSGSRQRCAAASASAIRNARVSSSIAPMFPASRCAAASSSPYTSICC
jgi:hypothetical protein